MKALKDIIFEKLIITTNSKKKEFTIEELMKDYDEVSDAYTKAEKKAIADKYNITDLRIRPIQIGILDIARELRQNQKEFTNDDVRMFFRYDIPDSYNKFEAYLKEESDSFVEYLLEHYKEMIKIKKSKHKYFGSSAADKHLLKILSNIQKYLGHE